MNVRQTPFRGRTAERRLLERLLDGVREGTSAAIVIRGEAGIGKTAMMHYASRQASGCRVARITGVESELELPFAAVHQLCLPLLEHLRALPSPQGHALQVAFGLEGGDTPDRFLVGLAVLTLLAEAAYDRPLVCLIDDAQWLDEPSTQVLGFVARRLNAESILMLFAVREVGGTRRFAGLPDLTLEGLTTDDARTLLTAAVPGHLDEKIRDRLVAETGGNPLALLELPRELSSGELAGGFVAHSSHAISGRLQESYVRRARSLPPSARQLMLLAAADPTGDATLLWRAAQKLNIAPGAAEAAERENLLKISSQVQFRHPLARAAAYMAGSAEDRRAAHLALAEATNIDRDPERRVWHLAVAATGPDESVALELERAADTARARAGLSASAAFLERSFALTAEPNMRLVRGLAAATANLQAGSLAKAQSLVAESAVGELDDLQRARVELLNGQIDAAMGPGSEAPLRLLKAAKRLEPLDPALARDTYLECWWPAILAGTFAASGGTMVDVARTALAAPWPAARRPWDYLLESLATAAVEGRPAAAAGLRSIVELSMTGRVPEEDRISWARFDTSAAYLLWDFNSWAELTARQVARARESGALASLLLALNAHTNVTTLRGELDRAGELVAEHYAVKEVTGIQLASYGAFLLAAYRGDNARLAALQDEPLGPADGYALEVIALARAILNNGQRRYAQAAEAAAELPATTFFHQQHLPELIEGACRSGQPDLARQAMATLSEAVVADYDWAQGIEARCRALLEEGENAEEAYRSSIECLARSPLRLDLGRAQLLYGEWLRREQRRTDAREQLRQAFDLFSVAGADAFADRARSELLATGETVRQREVGTEHDLTAQEEHIARLAGDGRSNPEIAAELFISPRTVEWHLRKVFSKLGITSRNALRDALPRAARGR